MAEYISREKIAAEARKLSTHPLNEWDTMGVLALIDRQPVADVAEVVRCKECAWWQNRWQPQSAPEEWHYCANIDISTPKDFYCAFGEKRQESEGEDNG